MKHSTNGGRISRAQYLGLPLALALLTLVLTGCPRDEYEVSLQPNGNHIERTLVFYRADGSNSNGVPRYNQFDTNELAMIAALYGAQGLTNAGGRHEVHGEFTNAFPDDVGGTGTYSNLTTSLGEAGFYVERFRGSDDLAGITERREQAANQLTGLLLGWSRQTLRREPGYDQLHHFLDNDFRRDLKNAGAYWWQSQFAKNYETNADEEFIARFTQYLIERKYFTTGEFPALYGALVNDDSQPVLHHVQRLVARAMGVPDSAPIPAALDFLGDEARMERSFDNYLTTTTAYHAKLKQWRQDQKSQPDLKQPRPEDVASDPLQKLIDFDLLGGTPDKLTVKLSLPTSPLHSNGQWDETLRGVVWDTAIGARSETNTLPFTCYATWVKPDEAFQTQHFGKVALTGDNLSEYCLWRCGLDVQRGGEWDAFLADLQPGTGLTNRLASFRFTGELQPAGTNAPAVVSPSAWSRNLLQGVLQ